MDSLVKLDLSKLISELDDISESYIYSYLEYLIKDVRITYLKDVEISVMPFINISAKEGDMTSISRWIAMILKEHGLIEVHDEDQLSYIKRALNRERISTSYSLSALDDDFYVRMNSYLREIDEKAREALIVSLNPFIASRLQKLVKLATSSPLVPEIEGKLSSEEKLLYVKLYEMTFNFKKMVLGIE